MQTSHFKTRKTQRSIPTEAIDLLEFFGQYTTGDKLVLSAKNCRQLDEFFAKQIALIESGKPSVLTKALY